MAHKDLAGTTVYTADGKPPIHGSTVTTNTGTAVMVGGLAVPK